MIFSMETLWIMIAISIVCLIGFKRYIWFISIGYGLSIAMVGIMLLILFNNILNLGYTMACMVLIFYGARLSGFLAFRELKNKTYIKKMKSEIKDGKNMNLGVKSIIWISCVLLYFMMCSPIIYRFVNNSGIDICFIIGIIVAAIGAMIEMIADAQKNNQKKINPNRFCDKGLYKMVRCPNYFGELMFWTGVFISGVTTLNGIGQWSIAILGFMGIVYVMFSGARRLELRQDKCYGENEEYQKYIKETPIMLPLLPLYSVKKYKWLVA